ncbi:MAG: amino acid permease [Bacteroidetes bacterium]|nr:MAG: amino acid permease [Bacteroidota bacterium]
MKPQGSLRPTFGLFTAVILILSSIIGSGVYKKIVPMSETLMSPGLVLACWVLAGVVSMLGALSAAEVSGLLAASGGQYVYFRKMYGQGLAFFFGWSCFAVIQSGSIASISYVFAQSVNGLGELPRLSAEWEAFSLGGVVFPFQNIGVKALAIALIWALTALNYRGVRQGGLLSTVVTLTIVAGILSVVVASLMSPQSSWENLQTPATGFAERQGGLFTPMFGAMLGAFFAYEGWNSISFIGGEIKDPRKNVPLALFFGMLAVITVYLIANFAYFYAMPIDDIIAVGKQPNSIAAVAVMERLQGNGGRIFISVLIVIGTLGCTNTTLLMAARVYQAMARDGLFFPRAAYIHPEYNTPTRALVMQAVWSSLLVLSGSFDQLTDMLIFASFIYYGANTFGVFILRRRMPDAERPYRTPGYPFVPALFVIFCIVLVINTLYNQPREALMGLGLILAGAPFFLYWRKRLPPQ